MLRSHTKVIKQKSVQAAVLEENSVLIGEFIKSLGPLSEKRKAKYGYTLNKISREMDVSFTEVTG